MPLRKGARDMLKVIIGLVLLGHGVPADLGA